MASLRNLFGNVPEDSDVDLVGDPELIEQPKSRTNEKKLACRRAFNSSWPTCHQDFDDKCAQCRFHAFGQKWIDAYGTELHRAPVGDGRKIVWLREQRFVPGPGMASSKQWGIGCAVCADFKRRLDQLPPEARTLRSHHLRYNTKWANFEIRACGQMQASAILQHSRTALHKLAMHSYLRPQLPVEIPVNNEGITAASSLLKGAVPPPEHWLRVWQYVHRPTSFRASETFLGTEAFIAHLRSGKKTPQDREKQ